MFVVKLLPIWLLLSSLYMSHLYVYNAAHLHLHKE